MKKLAAILLIGAMAISMFAFASAEGAQEVKLDLDNIYECYLPWPSLNDVPADLQMIEDAANKITEPKLGVHVVIQPMRLMGLTSQQQLMISSGEKMDIVQMEWTGLEPWVSTDSLLELEDLLPTYGKGIVDKFGESAFACTYNDHVYGLPVYKTGYAWGFHANSDILEKYGYDTSDRKITLGELEEIFETVKAGEGDGFYCAAGGGSFFGTMGRVDKIDGNTYTGVLMWDDPENIVNLYETEEFKKYAELMYDWAQKGYIAPDAATPVDNVNTQLASGKYLGMFYTTEDQEVQSSLSSNGTVPLTGLTIVDGYTTTSDLTGNMYGIAYNCENPEKTMALINEIYTNSELAGIIGYGIEGVHYVVKEENEEGQKIIAFPEGVDSSNSGFLCLFNVYRMGTDLVWEPSDFTWFEDRENHAETYEISPAFGYSFDSRNYSSQISALAAVYSEYYTIIDCGAINPDEELPAFINALKIAGIDEVIKANQEQYTEWLKKK